MIQLTIDQDREVTKGRDWRSLVKRVEQIISEHFSDTQGEIAVSIVNTDVIQRLNRQYRNKDTVTDVLSFTYDVQGDPQAQLGDIMICWDRAIEQAQGDIELEITDLLVHGVLHVLGYDHEEAKDAKLMFPLQDKLVQQVLSV